MTVGRIPKIIHYCWFGGGELSELAQMCIASWKKNCPDYEIIRWDESNYDYKRLRYTREAYEEKKYAFVSDVARLEVVYKYGGIYLDTDVEIIKPFDELLENVAFMGIETTSVALGLGFGAIPNFTFLKELIQSYECMSFYNEDGTKNLKTIPAYTTELLSRKGFVISSGIQKFDDITIYPAEYFNPKDYLTGEIHKTNNTFSIHHYNATWWGEKEKKEYKREQYIFQHFGKYGMKVYYGFKIIKKQGIKELINKIRGSIKL